MIVVWKKKNPENETIFVHISTSLIMYRKRPERQQGDWSLRGDFCFASIACMLFKNVFIYLL